MQVRVPQLEKGLLARVEVNEVVDLAVGEADLKEEESRVGDGFVNLGSRYKSMYSVTIPLVQDLPLTLS